MLVGFGWGSVGSVRGRVAVRGLLTRIWVRSTGVCPGTGQKKTQELRQTRGGNGVSNLKIGGHRVDTIGCLSVGSVGYQFAVGGCWLGLVRGQLTGPN